MSTNSLSSDATSDSSSVYHSCREGDSTDVDAASFKSFSTQSISTLNSYRSALSEFSSATGGFVSAREDESSDDDCLTLQGDEFGFNDSGGSTPVQSRRSTPGSQRDAPNPTPTPTPTPTPVIEEIVLPSNEEEVVAAVAAEPVVEIRDEDVASSSSDSEETRMMMEKSVFSTATALERSVIEIPPIPEIPENPEPPASPVVAGTALCCWKSPLIVIAAVATMTAVQLIMRSAMSMDFRWWKLVVVRGIVQVVIAGSLVFKRHFFRNYENLSSFFPTTCDFNLRSNGWTYFCQTVLSFVFIASTVECCKQVASPTLSTIYYLLPLAFVFIDSAKTRIVPKVMVLLSSSILVVSALLLTLPQNRCGKEFPDDCVSSNSTWASPFFNADLVYGWPIDPRHQGDDVHQMTASAIVIRITFILLSLGSTILSLTTLNDRSQLDSCLVLLCQGFGALLYAIMDAREWQSLDYPTMSQMIYNLIVACLGISANFCVVILTIQSQNSKTSDKHSTSAITTTSSATAAAKVTAASGEANSLLAESRRTPPNGNNSQESAMTSIVMSDMNHLPTMIAVLTSSQLLVVSFFNFIVISRSACCGFQDIFGVLLTLFLVTTISFIGLRPPTTLQNVRTFFNEHIKRNRRREVESVPC